MIMITGPSHRRPTELVPRDHRPVPQRQAKQTGGYEFVWDEEATESELLPGEELRDVVAA